MITSVKPVVITLFSCVLLKEPCGLFEVFNLLLVIVGICTYLQLFCLPDDAGERLGIFCLAFLGFAQQ